MKELTRTQIAAAKRTQKTLAQVTRKLLKSEAKVKEEQAKIEEYKQNIMLFDNPIIIMTGGFTSEQVVNEDLVTPKFLVEDGAIVGENPAYGVEVELEGLEEDLEEAYNASLELEKEDEFIDASNFAPVEDEREF